MNTSIQMSEQRKDTDKKQGHLDSLRLSKPLMESKGDIYAKERIKCEEEKIKATSEVEQLERSYLRDEVSAAEVDEARSKLANIKVKLEEAERMHNLALQEIQHIDQGILQAHSQLKDCIHRLCAYEREKMINVLNTDLELRKKLMEVYSAQMVKSNWSTPGWGRFLSAIFSAPTEAETKQAIASYKQRNGIVR